MMNHKMDQQQASNHNQKMTSDHNVNSTASLFNQSKDAQTMISVLKDMGVEEFEPRVVNQLLEISHRYITNLLEDARAFSSHAGKKTLDSEDIKMAIRSKVDYSFTTNPPRDLIMEISKTKNKNPLPPIKYHSGIRLPPDRFCLHAPNYVLKSQNIDNGSMNESQQVMMMNEMPSMPSATSNILTSRQVFTGGSIQQQSNNMSVFPPSSAIKRPRNDDDDDDYDI